MEVQLRQRTRALALENHVDFVGRVPHEDVPRLMQQFDIFVMPSVCREAFGVAAIEASSCELPIVASNVGGVPEAVLDSETGILVDPLNPVALAEACIELIDHPSLRCAMGKAGRQFVLDRFRAEDTGAKMETLYNSLLQM
jgi:glycosyltransferase involved in cell wall biosynthesis